MTVFGLNSQFQEVGVFVEESVKVTVCPETGFTISAEKSATGSLDGVENWKEAIRVPCVELPIYSLVYQKVWSSVGSTEILL